MLVLGALKEAVALGDVCALEQAAATADSVAVMALVEQFENSLASLQDSGRLRALDPCTVEDHGCVSLTGRLDEGPP